MTARRTKASRRAAFRGWLARLAVSSAPTGPVWVVRLDPAPLPLPAAPKLWDFPAG